MAHKWTLTLPIAPCTDCGTTKLLRADLDSADHLTHVCIDCETRIGQDAIKWATIEEINRSGYITEGWVDPHGTRGCRDGACGIEQPT